MKKLNRKTPIVFYVGVMLLCLVMFSFNLTSGLYARYATEDMASDRARVAKFVFDVKKSGTSEFIDISNIQKPGDNAVYDFIVSNGTMENCCEVEQNYTVSVTIQGSMPLSYTIQKNEESAVSADVSDTLPAGEPHFDTYRLTIEWPNEENDAVFANGTAVGEVILTITSVQVD